MSSMRLKLIGASDDAFCARDPFILALEDGSLCVPGKRRSQTAADPCRSLSYLCASAMSSIASEAVIPFHHENELIYPTWWLLYLHIYTSLPLTHTYSTNSLCLLASVFCLLLFSSPTYYYPGISQSSISEALSPNRPCLHRYWPSISFFFISHLSFWAYQPSLVHPFQIAQPSEPHHILIRSFRSSSYPIPDPVTSSIVLLRRPSALSSFPFSTYHFSPRN